MNKKMNINKDDIYVEIKENDDGSADMIFDLSDNFQKEFCKLYNLDKFDQKEFESFVYEALGFITEKSENNEEK